MYSTILIRYGELSTKGKNKMTFVRQLEKNIKTIVKDNPKVEFDRMFMNYSEDSMKSLQKIFGIQSYSPVMKTETNIESIENTITKLLEGQSNKTFKVIVKRHWKDFPGSSMDISRNLGGHVLRNFDLKVDVKNPEIRVEVEIRKDFTYVFSERVMGIGGYPTGVNGKVLHLISGGLDSPIAALEMMKRGIHVDFLNFITPPHTDQKTIDKVNEIINFLIQYQGSGRLFRSTYTDLMNLIGLTSKQGYKINLMRRSFYRIADELASKNKYAGISNGENLGQVASQTLESINTIQTVCKLPIYRPLLTADKIETINKAIKFGTYDISIQDCAESCELFAPKAPVIKPTIGMAEKLEEELKIILDLERKNIDEQIEIINFNID